jgi:hypothetical protein
MAAGPGTQGGAQPSFYARARPVWMRAAVMRRDERGRPERVILAVARSCPALWDRDFAMYASAMTSLRPP